MKKKIYWVTCTRTGGLFTLLGGRASLQDTKWNICYQYYYAFQWHATSDKSDTQHVCTCMFKNHHEQMKKRIKIYHLQPVGVTYWPRWGKPIFPDRFVELSLNVFQVYILMIILEVTSYWGMRWGKKSISLRNIRHQRYLVLDIGAVYGILTLGFTHHCTKGREGVDGAPLGFLFCCNIWSLIFYLLYNMRYILWVVELLEAVTSPNMVAILATILDFIKN